MEAFGTKTLLFLSALYLVICNFKPDELAMGLIFCKVVPVHREIKTVTVLPFKRK